MKKLIFILFASGCLCANAQEGIKLDTVITADSISAKELFLRAREWTTDAFKDSKKVIESMDKESGEVGNVTAPPLSEFFQQFTLMYFSLFQFTGSVR